MPRLALLLLATAGLGLAGCASPAPQGAAAEAAAGGTPFHCPKPGTAARFGSGRPVVYNGADPSDPMACLVTNPNGTTARRIANFVTPSAGQEGAVREGMSQLFPLVPGKTARYSYFQGYRDDPTRTGQYRETWTVVGPEAVQVGGKPVQAVLVTRELQETQAYGVNSMRWKLWYDGDSGVWVRGEPTLLSGYWAPVRPFAATSLSVP